MTQHPVQPQAAVPAQPVPVQGAPAQAVAPQAAFVHQPDCEYSMGTVDPVCSCPKQAVTTEPVAGAAAAQQAGCVGDTHQPGCAHRV